MTTDQIFQKLGIEESDEAFKAKILSKVMGTADLRFARVVDEIMTDEEREEFEAFSEGKEPQEIAKWVSEKYEGIGEMYDQVVEDVVTELKNKQQ